MQQKLLRRKLLWQRFQFQSNIPTLDGFNEINEYLSNELDLIDPYEVDLSDGELDYDYRN